MSSYDISRIQTLIASSKIKERNDGLEALSQIILTPKLASHSKHLSQIADSLFGLLTYEKKLYLKSGTSSVEARLTKCSSVLKNLVERSSNNPNMNVKTKIYFNILEYIFEYYSIDSLFDPVLSDLVRTIQLILEQSVVQDYISLKDWGKMFNFLTKCIRTIISDSGILMVNERVLTQLYVALGLLVQSENSFAKTYLPLYESKVHLKIIETIKLTFKNYKKENLITISIFKIINKLMLTLGTHNLKICRKLVILGIRIILFFPTTKFEMLKEQYLVFLNIGNDYIDLSKTSKMAGSDHYMITEQANTSINSDDSTVDDYITDEESPEILLYSLGNLIVRLIDGFVVIENQLKMNSFNFSVTSKNNKITWFKLNSIQLNSSEANPWLLRLGVVKLLKAYFDMKSDTDVVNMQVPKRQKLDFSGDQLSRSLNPLEYLNSLISSRNVNLQTAGLQLLTFYLESSFESSSRDEQYLSEISSQPSSLGNSTKASKSLGLNNISAEGSSLLSAGNHLDSPNYEPRLSGIDRNSVFKSVLDTFENSTLNYWSILSCNSILCNTTGCNRLRSANITRLLKLSLQLIKSFDLCDVACITVVNILKLEYYDIEKSILSQLENLVDLSEINGPCLISNHVFKFWYYIYKLCKQLNLVKNLGSKIQDWFLNKARLIEYENERLELSSNHSSLQLPQFISWLCGAPVKIRDHTFPYGSVYDIPFQLNLQRERLKKFILLKNLCEEDNNEELIPEIITTNAKSEEMLMIIIKRGEELMNQNGKKYTAMFNWLITIMGINESIRAQDKLKYIASSFEYQATRLLDNFQNLSHLSSDIKYTIASWMLDVNFARDDSADLLLDCPILDDLFESISGMNAVKEQREAERKKHDSNFQNLEDFTGDLIFERSKIDHIFGNNFKNVDVSVFVLKFLIKLNKFKKADPNSALSSILTYISSLDSSDFLMCCDYLSLEYLNVSDLSSISASLLDRMIRLLGDKLLKSTKLGRGDKTIVIVSKLCYAMIPFCINTPNELLKQDFFDVFSYFEDLAKQKLIITESGLLGISQFLIQILIYNDQSWIKNNTVMDIFLEIFESSSNLMRIEMSDSLRSLISSVSIEKQSAIYKALFEKFDAPQQSVETTATFCLFFTIISRSSHTILMTSVFNLIEYSIYPHFLPFLKQSFDTICKDNSFADKRSIFQLFKLEILKFWWQYKLDIREFPFKILDYHDSIEFINENYKEMVAVFLSSMEKSNQQLLEYVSSSLQVKREDLIYDSIPLIIALSFTSDGLRNKIFDKLNEYFDEKQLTEMFQNQLIFIVNELIKSADLSDEVVLYDLLKKLSVNSMLDMLVKKDSEKLFAPPNVSISVSTTVRLLGELIVRFSSSIAEFWSQENIYFVLKNQTSLLIKAINDNERLLALRKIKFCVILSGASFSNLELINFLFKNLGSFLIVPKLHDDISFIFLALFQMGKHTFSEGDLNPLIISVATQLVNCKFSKNPINTDLKDQLEVYIARCDKSDSLFAVLQAASDIINDFQLTIETSDIERALSGPIYSVMDSENTSHLMSLLSLIFHFKPELSRQQPVLASSKIVKLLLEINSSKSIIKHLTKPFKLWKSRYLGYYYDSTGEVVEIGIKEYNLSFGLEEFTEKINTLDSIFEEFLKYLRSSDIEVVFSIESIIGVILWKQKKNPGDIKKYMNFETLFFDKFDHILPIDFHMCILLNVNDKNGRLILHHGSFAQIVDRLLADLSNLEFDIWCSRLFLSVVNDLVKLTSIAPLLSVFVVKVPDIAKRVLPFLICYLINTIGSYGANTTNQLIDNYLNYPNKKSPDKKFIVDLVLLIRSGAKQGVDVFVQCYSEIDIKMIYMTATSIGMAKTGLMLLEDYYSTQIFSWATDKPFLKSLYEKIDHPDLIYGLPIEPTLDHAISLMNKNKDNSLNKVMFNSGLFDASLKIQETGEFNPFMIDSMQAAGSHGLSKLINEYYSSHDNNIDSKEQMYNWAWKLNQWEAPIPNKYANENEALYKTLKLIHDYPSKALQICEDALCGLTDERMNFLNQSSKSESNRSKMRNWMRTVASVLNIESIVGYRAVNIQDKIESHNMLTKWYQNADFADYENIILVREAAFELLGSFPTEANKLGKELSWISAIFELSKYGNFARMNGQNQKGVNASTLIDSISKCKFESSSPDLQSYLKRFSMYEAAATLWYQGETGIPVVMLKEIQKQSPVFTNNIVPYRDMDISPPLINAYLVKWSSESRQEISQSIMNKYVIPTNDMKIDNPNQQAKVFHMLAKFCDQQLKSGTLHTELTRFEKTSELKKAELEQIKDYYSNHKVTSDEKTLVQRYYSKLKTQYAADIMERNSVRDNMNQCVEKAVVFYLKSISISDDFNDEDIDRFCALWLEYSDRDDLNIKIGETLLGLSSYKLITWVSQLISRLSDEVTEFQKVLQRLLIVICFNHPFHTLYYLKSLMLHGGLNADDNSISNSRCKAANRIWSELMKKSSSFLKNILKPLNEFCDQAISLSSHKVSRAKKLELSNLKIGTWWMKELKMVKLPPPTLELPISVDSVYNSAPYIVSMDPIVTIAASGLSLPKIATFTLSNGVTHKMLLKHGSDDLRQDAIMEQVFEQVNKLFQKNKETRIRNLRIRTYKAIPLGPQSGVIEFVANSIALIDVIKPYHSKHDKIKVESARDMMKNVQSSDRTARLKVYNDITDKKIKPILKYWFFENFINPDTWFESKIIYSHGIATSSMVGHVLGLGDRHCNNILLDKSSGEPIHIDLGVAFDQGKLLPIPETVPFRLTRDIVDGFGVTGTNGIFKNSSEHTFRVLRNEAEHILGILDVLRWDPLYSWTLSPLKKQKLHDQIVFTEASDKDGNNNFRLQPEEDGSEAGRAVVGVRNKLISGGLSVEATVRELIQEAVDPQNLACIYCGWCPFY